MDKRLLLVSALLTTMIAACEDENGPCDTKNAVRDQHHICNCPAGWRVRGNTCEPDDAGVSTSPSSAAEAGPAISATGGLDGGRDAGTATPPLDAVDAGAMADAGALADAGAAIVDAAAPPPSVDAEVSLTDAAPPAPACVAVPEVCDGKDNDCDGTIDNGVKNECGACAKLEHAKGEACSNGGVGVCAKPGSYQCMGEVTVCNAPPPVASTEICDGIDNDCDGVADDGIVKNACQGCAALAHAKDSACSDGVGECKVDGAWECTGTESVACTAKARAPAAEACDGKDNDCDGMVDEGVTNCVNGQVNDCPPDACAPGSCEDGVNSYTCRCGAGYFAVGHECTRFRNNGDFTVSDAKTGLVWQQDVDANSYSYAEALGYCAGSQLGASKGRLPTLDELKSLVDSRFTPPIDPQYFRGTSASTSDLRALFWSSTPAGSSTSPMTGVFYGYSYAALMSAAINADTAVSVRCVR